MQAIHSKFLSATKNKPARIEEIENEEAEKRYTAAFSK